MRRSSDFEDIAPHLQAAGYPVIAPDLRGRGLSARDRLVTNYQTNVYVHDPLELLSVLNVHRVIVLGSAHGGLVGLMLGAAQPALVSGLTLNDRGPEVARAGAERFLAFIARQSSRAWGTRIRGSGRSRYRTGGIFRCWTRRLRYLLSTNCEQ